MLVKNTRAEKIMLTFDKYLEEMEERRAMEKRSAFNAAIAQGLCEKTHEEAVAELYACLTFAGGVSEILAPVAAENRLQLVF